VLDSATRLALVTTRHMDTSVASMALFARENRSAPWRQQGASHWVRLGRNGVAWGAGFMQHARQGEPRKRERDWRTPAGLYRIGTPFGFGPSKRPGHLQLKAGETFCVDDVRSPAYNTITTIAKAGRVTGERMANVPNYRHGLFIDYPSTYQKPAGSCIFIHLSSGRSTAGCIAMAERRLIALQDFAEKDAVIAVLPRGALDRFKGCLP
jgi:L,D-peptidoglycan transpeptidase YkuD (ErfK/YbiS/YcfS/YnhG family)